MQISAQGEEESGAVRAVGASMSDGEFPVIGGIHAEAGCSTNR